MTWTENLANEFSNYSMMQYTSLLVAGFLCGSIQATVGFGAGLFGIPFLMLFVGIELPQAITLVAVVGIIQCSFSIHRMRHQVVFRDCWRPALLRLILMPVGLACAATWGREHARPMVGAVILLVLACQYFASFRRNRRTAQAPHVGWEYVAFTTSGFFLGLCGMGGPLMGLWVIAQPWTVERTRAFMFVQLAAGTIPLLIALFSMYGVAAAWASLVGIAMVPFVLGGTWLGTYIGERLSRERFQVAFTALLLIIAVRALIS